MHGMQSDGKNMHNQWPGPDETLHMSVFYYLFPPCWLIHDSLINLKIKTTDLLVLLFNFCQKTA